MTTRDEIRDGLKSSGLSRVADDIAELAQTCVRFHTKAKEDSKLPVGSSKLGGSPDLPDAIEWPSWQGHPLGFLGQINLGEISSFPSCEPLPKSGLLSFFYDPDQGTWGFDPEDKGSWRIIFSAGSPDKLVRRNPPAEIPDYARYRACAVKFFEAVSMPGVESIAIWELEFDEREADKYSAFLEEFRNQQWSQAGHQVLGHPEEIQGDMQLECQLVSNGLYCGNESGYRSPRREKLEPGAAAWKLLLQLDSDENAATMWGDLGSLYFWIRENDLQIGNFKNVWMILQCS
jgi:uncharacterized protein YwqG